MATERVMQGNDVAMRTFNIQDSNGSNILIANINDYNIYVYSLDNGEKKNKLIFRKTPGTGEKQIIVVDTTTIGFVVDRNYTKTAKPGKLYAEIEVQISAGSAYISSLQNSGYDGYAICEIVQSAR